MAEGESTPSSWETLVTSVDFRQPPPFISYPPIEMHGVVGDRRTAAMVAADGTIDWLCVPDYDGIPVFGALLDAQHGGWWRLGPADPQFGTQRYEPDTAMLTTEWVADGGTLLLTDLMLWPEDVRSDRDTNRRVIVRTLTCTSGTCDAVCDVRPKADFAKIDPPRSVTDGHVFTIAEHTLGLWTSVPLEADESGCATTIRLKRGDQFTAVISLDETPTVWSESAVRRLVKETRNTWKAWNQKIIYTGPRSERVRQSATTVRLLSYAPTGALVAAPTTSLPERIGGDRNYDYRLAWVRDASLSLAILSLLGDTSAAQRYMDWLAGLESATDSPLQVVYRIDGRVDVTQHERTDISGYRESQPVRFGNHAFEQRQLDSLGYFNDCALVYLKHGGAWKDEYWTMVQAAAEYTVANWRLPDSGIWELPVEQHYVSSKVMSWVALERAVQIAKRTGQNIDVDPWTAEMEMIHQEVMERGWSESLGSFTQRYGADTLDAAALLIPVMGFLPHDHRRVVATTDRIAETLSIDGLVHRFLPAETPGHPDMPLGEFEGAFLPCTFWLATAYALSGRVEEAERVLRKVEESVDHLGLLAEEIDSRSGAFLGNTPLLFSQVEYVRAVMEVAKARPLDRARLSVGMARQRVKHLSPRD
ncbi:MAG: glycoside hydrolase family 15 protein [Thermomicrobiales bacterium]